MTTTTPQTTVARRTRLAAAVIAVTAWLGGSAHAIAAPPNAGPPAGIDEEIVVDEPLADELEQGHHGELRFLLARALLEPRADLVEGRRQLELAERELSEAGEAFEYARRLLAEWRREHPDLGPSAP